MKKFWMALHVVILVAGLTSLAGAQEKPSAPKGAEPPHWGYSGNVGPDRWSALSPAYEMCGLGRNQSPIDLTVSSQRI